MTSSYLDDEALELCSVVLGIVSQIDDKPYLKDRYFELRKALADKVNKTRTPLTEAERDALSDVVIDYEWCMVERYGDHLKPGMAMSAEGNAIALAKAALSKL
jgi:hypothetical protein